MKTADELQAMAKRLLEIRDQRLAEMPDYEGMLRLLNPGWSAQRLRFEAMLEWNLDHLDIRNEEVQLKVEVIKELNRATKQLNDATTAKQAASKKGGLGT